MTKQGEMNFAFQTRDNLRNIIKSTYPFSIIRCFAEFSNAESGETSQSITRNLSKQILSVKEKNIKNNIVSLEKKHTVNGEYKDIF